MKKILIGLFLLSSLPTWAVTNQNKVSMVTFFPVPYVAYSNVSVAKEMDIGLTNQACSLTLGSAGASTAPLEVVNTNVTSGALFLGGNGAVSTTGQVALGSANSSWNGIARLNFDNNLAVETVTGATSLNTPELHVSTLNLFGRTFPACNVNGDHTISWAELALGPNKNKKEVYLVCGPVPTDCPASTKPSETCECSNPAATGSKVVTCNANGTWSEGQCTCSCPLEQKPDVPANSSYYEEGKQCSCAGTGSKGTKHITGAATCNLNTGYWSVPTTCINCQCRKISDDYQFSYVASGATDTENCDLSGYTRSSNDPIALFANSSKCTGANGGTRTRTCQTDGSWSDWGSCSNTRQCCSNSTKPSPTATNDIWNCYGCYKEPTQAADLDGPKDKDPKFGYNPQGTQFSFYYASNGPGNGYCTRAKNASSAASHWTTGECDAIKKVGPAVFCYHGNWVDAGGACAILYPSLSITEGYIFTEVNC